MRQKAKKSIDTVLTPKSSLTWKRRFYQMHSPISLVGSFRLQRIGSQVLRITWSDFRHSQTKCKQGEGLSVRIFTKHLNKRLITRLALQTGFPLFSATFLSDSLENNVVVHIRILSCFFFFRYWKCTTSVVKSGFFIRNWGYGLLHFLFED